MTEQDRTPSLPETSTPNQGSRRLPGGRHSPWGAALWAAGIFLLVLIVWLNIPAINPLVDRVAHIGQTLTPTATITPSPTVTHTPTTIPSPTVTSLPSQTPMPASAYLTTEMERVAPPIRGVTGAGYILNDDLSVTAEPAFDTLRWIPSQKIGDQLGSVIAEPYYATFGAASVTWAMDVPIPAGIYELHVMDTVYSSAGPLEFSVTLDGQPLTPLFGSPAVEFQSSRGDFPQTADQWHSLGFYRLDHPGILSVSSAWENRDERSIVAVDRIAVVPFPDSTRLLTDPLPENMAITFVDDSGAAIHASQVVYPEKTGLAWRDQYQFLVNPQTDLTVEWAPADPLPIGQYQVAVWFPKMHSTGEVNYDLSVDGEVIPNDQTGGPVTLAESTGAGQWVSLGTWTTPRIYEKPVKLALKMTAKAGSSGEFSFDVAAFIKLP